MDMQFLKALRINNPVLDRMTDQDVLIIGELARTVSLEPKTIRFYEKAGLLSPARQGKFRIFRKQDAERLFTIKALRSLGVSIKDIRTLLQLEVTNNEEDADKNANVSILKDHLVDLQRRREEINSSISTVANLLSLSASHEPTLAGEAAQDAIRLIA
jgi:DNA-binding transcriptional MerR regulator